MVWDVDPFSVKKYRKIHPLRVGYTIYARCEEFISRAMFRRYELPNLPLYEGLASHAEVDQDTAVTAHRTAHLLTCLRETEHFAGTSVVEVGAYRGATTERLAGNTKRTVYAVDPYIGYGGALSDEKMMLGRTGGFPNVIPVKMTSGQAAREWKGEPPSFVFIDAVHDYVNTRFDALRWGQLLVPGGLLAFHDVDNKQFAGTRRAAFLRLREGFVLYAHVHDLAIFTKVR